MQEVSSYLLILIIWHPDHPGEFDLKPFPQIFTSLEECHVYGRDSVAKYEIYKESFHGEQRSYRCIVAPSKDETQEALEEHEKESGK
jgi:hypothetical protein